MCQALFREQAKDYAEFFALFLLGFVHFLSDGGFGKHVMCVCTFHDLKKVSPAVTFTC